MNVDLQPVADALATLAEGELRAIVMATNEGAPMAADLLSWMERLADWEVIRRAELYVRPQPPHATISPHESTDTIIAATMIRDGFAERRANVPERVITFLDEVVDTLARTQGERLIYGSTLR